LFVNGRWVRDRGLAQALQEAYRGLLMTGRYAVAFLFVELPPDQVDVNVHPAKAEVRFREPAAVQQLLIEAVRQRLRAENWTARLRAPLSSGAAPSPTPAQEPGRPSAASGGSQGPESALFPAAEGLRPSPVVLSGAEHNTAVRCVRTETQQSTIAEAPSAEPLRAV
jgi:DNA mismatch repair ATPase MutL